MGGGRDGCSAARSAGSGGGGGVIASLKKRLLEIVAIGGFFAVAWLGWETRDYFGQKDVGSAVAEAKSEAESLLRSQFATDLALAKVEAYDAGKTEGQAELRQELDDRLQDKADIAYLIGITLDPQIYNRLPANGQAIVDRSAQTATDSGIAIPKSILPAEITESPETACINPSGLFPISKNQRFTLCGSNEVFIVKSIEDHKIYFSVNGRTVGVSFTGRTSFSEGCFVAYERAIETGNDLQAEIRLGCQ
jgi:hypothetical protein